MSAARDDADTLRQRAHALATRKQQSASTQPWREVLLFETSVGVHAVATSELRAVVQASPITPLPGLPPWLLGIVSIRGEVLCVLDLSELRGKGRTGHTPWFAIVCVDERALAIGVSEVRGFRTLHHDELRPDLRDASLEQHFIETVTDDLVSVLDVRSLLSSERILVGHTGVTFDAHEAAR